MKSFPPSLQGHLDSGTTTLAWCWRLSRKDGEVFGFSHAACMQYRRKDAAEIAERP
ncbi:MAG: DUF2163 domain-containing protein [Rhodobacteraceae bacterium]|nr:DUF2163 domain-containing protein [Paracoccaceae bacterium]